MTDARPADIAARATDRATVANDASHAITVVLAPSANEHLLAPGDTVVAEAEGPAGSHAELLIERTCDTAVVWTWAGARIRLLAPDGAVLVDWAGPPRDLDP